MAQTPKPKNEAKTIRIPMLASELDVEKHGGKEALSIAMRAVRDLNKEALTEIINKIR